MDINVGTCGKITTKVKIEGENVPTCYVDLLYGTKLDIIFDKKAKLSQRSFWEKYGISNESMTPKRLKIRKYIEEEEVVALFGPYSHNRYKYCHQKQNLVDDLAPENSSAQHSND